MTVTIPSRPTLLRALRISPVASPAIATSISMKLCGNMSFGRSACMQPPAPGSVIGHGAHAKAFREAAAAVSRLRRSLRSVNCASTSRMQQAASNSRRSSSSRHGDNNNDGDGECDSDSDSRNDSNSSNSNSTSSNISSNPESESRIRIQNQNPESESRIRIQNQNPES